MAGIDAAVLRARLASLERLARAALDQVHSLQDIVDPLLVGYVIDVEGAAEQPRVVWKGIPIMAFVLGDHQQVQLVVRGVDKAGNREAAQLDTPAVWSSSDTTIATVDTDPSDPTGATGLVKAVGPLGNVTVTATGAGGAGTVLLNDTFDLTIGTEAEVGFVLEPGAPQEQP